MNISESECLAFTSASTIQKKLTITEGFSVSMATKRKQRHNQSTWGFWKTFKGHR